MADFSENAREGCSPVLCYICARIAKPPSSISILHGTCIDVRQCQYYLSLQLSFSVRSDSYQQRVC